MVEGRRWPRRAPRTTARSTATPTTVRARKTLPLANHPRLCCKSDLPEFVRFLSVPCCVVCFFSRSLSLSLSLSLFLSLSAFSRRVGSSIFQSRFLLTHLCHLASGISFANGHRAWLLFVGHSSHHKLVQPYSLQLRDCNSQEKEGDKNKAKASASAAPSSCKADHDVFSDVAMKLAMVSKAHLKLGTYCDVGRGWTCMGIRMTSLSLGFSEFQFDCRSIEIERNQGRATTE